MIKKISSILQTECRLDQNKLIVVGISGGPDSLCLLNVLNELGYQVMVAHLDHALRPESHLEAEFVKKFALEKGLKFVLKRENVIEFAQSHQLSIEEAARIMRYRFLFQVADQYNAQAVAVGHTADDQVETVLMHLLRGAGIAGLRGMEFRSLPNTWSEAVPLVRPLLGIWREEILEYLKDCNLTPQIDASNQEIRYFRNKLRQELVPYLKSYNPGIQQVLWRMSQTLQEDYKFIQSEVGEAWLDCLVRQEGGLVVLKLQNLKSQPRSLQNYLFRKAINNLRPGLQDLDYEKLAVIHEFISNPPQSSRIELYANIRLALDNDQVFLINYAIESVNPQWPQTEPGKILPIEIPGKIALENGWFLSIEILTRPDDMDFEMNQNAYQAWIDLDNLILPLFIRTRVPGDRFQPLGMSLGTAKISDVMINSKLPRRARARWPLIISGDQIAWIPGIQIAHPFRVTSETRRAAFLKLAKLAETREGRD